MSITIKEVARKAGVSTATAARVLGGYGYTSSDARQKVLQAAAELSYNPNFVAKSMITGRTRVIGLIIADINNPFYSRIAKGIGSVVTPLGYTLVVNNTNEDMAEELRAIRFLLQQQVEGIIISPADSRCEEGIKELLKVGKPVVLIDRLVDHVDADVVCVENEAGALAAVSHLLALGHKRIGFIGGSPAVNSHRERLNGYKKALQSASIPYRRSLIKLGNTTAEEAEEAARLLLTGPHRPTAIFSINNTVILGLLSAVKSLQIKVPQELSIISFDDVEWFPLLNPAIGAVEQPVNQIGEMAAKLLISRLNGENPDPQVVRLPSRLILRQSTAPAPRT